MSEPITRAEVESIVQERVGKALDDRIQSYRKLLYAFFVGLLLLLIIVVGNGLMARQALIVQLHDAIFSFRNSLDRFLGNQIAYSFSDQFWLGRTGDKRRDVTFFLRRGQSAFLYLSVKHFGTGTPAVVTVTVDGGPQAVWQSGDDTTQFVTKSLTDFLPKNLPPEANIHVMTVSIDSAKNPADSAFIRALVTVVGLEES